MQLNLNAPRADGPLGRSQSGMTLIEILVAVLILLGVSTITMAVMTKGSASIQHTDFRSRGMRLAQLYIEELGRQCRSNLVATNPKKLGVLRGTVSTAGNSFSVLQDYGQVPDPLAPLREFGDYRVRVDVLEDTPASTGPTPLMTVGVVVWWRSPLVDEAATDRPSVDVRRVVPNYHAEACK